jgi:hypothetical protein
MSNNNSRSTFASMLKDGVAVLAGPVGSGTARPLSIMGHLVFVEDAPRRVRATKPRIAD